MVVGIWRSVMLSVRRPSTFTFVWASHGLYTLTMGPYTGLKDGGIVVLCMILTIVLILYYIVIYAYNFTLYSWMAYPCIATYIAVIVFAVAI